MPNMVWKIILRVEDAIDDVTAERQTPGQGQPQIDVRH